MELIRHLKEDHKAIRVILRALDSICKEIESEKEIDISRFKKILGFMESFIEQCHQVKEEKLLFPEMENTDIPGIGIILGEIILEHNAANVYIKSMGNAIANSASEDTSLLLNILKNASSYIALISQHIENEEDAVYSLIDEYLSEEKQESLLEKFEWIERDKIGIDKYAELINFFLNNDI